MTGRKPGGVESILGEGDEDRLNRLAACLRLAEQLERGRAGGIRDVRVEAGGDGVRVLVTAEGDPAIAIWSAELEAPAVQRAFGRHPNPRLRTLSGTPIPRPAYTGSVRNSYTLGRVAGIEIGLNWSVLALLALIMWTLATGIFPDTNPGLGDNSYFAMAVVGIARVLRLDPAARAGHAVQARRDGMQIDGITLWLFGGVARFSGMFPTAGAEFRIAVAGPLVSLRAGGGPARRDAASRPA